MKDDGSSEWVLRPASNLNVSDNVLKLCSSDTNSKVFESNPDEGNLNATVRHPCIAGTAVSSSQRIPACCEEPSVSRGQEHFLGCNLCVALAWSLAGWGFHGAAWATHGQRLWAVFLFMNILNFSLAIRSDSRMLT